MALIEVRGVTKDYQDGSTVVQALRGVDLDIAKGEFTAIAGPSGSGKTTLLNVIGGLDAVTEGSVRVGDLCVSDMRSGALTRMRRENIGFVFQAYNLIPVLTAVENVEFVMMLQGIPAWERRQRAEEILERVGLVGEKHRRPSALSGGQQQRVAVARAMVSRPSVVLADEPTANLDSDTGAKLLDLMKSLNAEDGVTFLFSTHDPMVIEYAGRVVRLHDGRVFDDEVRERPEVAEEARVSEVAVPPAGEFGPATDADGEVVAERGDEEDVPEAPVVEAEIVETPVPEDAVEIKIAEVDVVRRAAPETKTDEGPAAEPEVSEPPAEEADVSETPVPVEPQPREDEESPSLEEEPTFAGDDEPFDASLWTR
jgi:putative ABC transport system ATP-binding protein